MSDFSIDELLVLQSEAQIAVDERQYKYGYIGLKTGNTYYIPNSERGLRLLSITLEDGTIIKADAPAVLPIAGTKVKVRKRSGVWVIDGADEREVTSTTSGASAFLPRHNHNIGAPTGLFYPVDPASINDGMVLPTGNGLHVTIGRVSYPKDDGSYGVYDASGTLNLASALTGLSANESRWVIVYIDKSDGSVGFYSATAGTAPINTTDSLEDAIAECLSAVNDAYPYHAVRIRAGLSTFSSYNAMVGRSMEDKDFIRFQINSSGASAETVINRIVTDANFDIVVDANGNVVIGA